MKILVICQYYAPEPFRISDICEALVEKGNDVTVVTGTPNYPMGIIYEGYENGLKCDEVLNGVRVHRCKTLPRKKGPINRFLNYYSYPHESVKYINKLHGDFDVVFINQLSPVMMAEAGIKYAKKHNIKSVLYCLDLWPESLVFGGVNRSSIIYKYFNQISKKIYKNVDKILVTSRSFAEYFDNQFGIKNAKYLPQYAEALFTPDECKKEQNEYIDLMFAGNVGIAQFGEVIIKAANRCKDIKNLRWHVVGDGVELDKLKSMAKETCSPIIFYGRKPLEQMPEYYSKADAMLVTMIKDPVLSQTLPGKVQTYMAAGKPIIGSIDGETERVVNEAKCGFISPAEDDEKLAIVVRKFVGRSYNERMNLGINASDYCLRCFSRERFITDLIAELKE